MRQWTPWRICSRCMSPPTRDRTESKLNGPLSKYNKPLKTEDRVERGRADQGDADHAVEVTAVQTQPWQPQQLKIPVNLVVHDPSNKSCHLLVKEVSPFRRLRIKHALSNDCHVEAPCHFTAHFSAAQRIASSNGSRAISKCPLGLQKQDSDNGFTKR